MIEKYKPKNRIEFLEMIDWVYERKYENVNINMKYDGLEVEYDLIKAEPEDPKLTEQLLKLCFHAEISEINGKHQACFIPYPDF
jgi:short-subunit dehydrogenase involved in D-alanine esterification of teichoic acids